MNILPSYVSIMIKNLFGFVSQFIYGLYGICFIFLFYLVLIVEFGTINVFET